MNHSEQLFEQFRLSIRDLDITSSEYQKLKEMLQDEPLPKSQRGVLLARIFNLAEEKLGKGQNSQVMEWLKESNKLIMNSLSGPGGTTEVYFSPGPDCMGTINHQLESAQSSIDICVFTISDDRITDCILRAHERGVAIRLITDNDKLHDSGSDIQRIAESGIHVKVDRTRHHMHHKFATFDQRRCVTGSYNWTRSAEKNNEENLLLTNRGRVVRQYQEAFEELWGKMELYQID